MDNNRRLLELNGIIIKRELVKKGNHIISHNLGYKPSDILVTKNAHLVSINWKGVSANHVSINVAEECSVRILVGAVENVRNI